jgi:hypothetical protein
MCQRDVAEALCSLLIQNYKPGGLPIETIITEVSDTLRAVFILNLCMAHFCTDGTNELADTIAGGIEKVAELITVRRFEARENSVLPSTKCLSPHQSHENGSGKLTTTLVLERSSALSRKDDLVVSDESSNHLVGQLEMNEQFDVQKMAPVGTLDEHENEGCEPDCDKSGARRKRKKVDAAGWKRF